VVSSPPGSLVQRAPWCVALGLATALFLPGPAHARFVPQDDAPPSVTYSIDGSAGTNGWYVSPTIVVHWSVTGSVTSTSGCEPAISIPNPDPGSTRTCTASGPGGTTAVTTKTLKVDATAPTGLTAAATRSPDHNGWFNGAVEIDWKGTDVTSGIDSCTSLIYAGPDSATASKSGTCTDKAGNTSGATSFGFKYDDTLPSVSATPARPPDHAGWYNQPLSISWTGTDATSGINAASCTSLSYKSPDAVNASASGSCADNAGNTRQVSFPFSYDSTAPSAPSANATRSPDHNGWFNGAVEIDWKGTDVTSGIDSCTSLIYAGPDSATASKSGTCTDKAGNTSGATSFGFKYDNTPPAVTAAATRGPDNSGWYNAPVGISWSGTDATSGIASCSAPATYSGPDSKNASSSGGCTDKAGNAGTPPPLSIKYDATPPVATTVPDRGPDANGWYNHGLTIGWSSSDPVSGIASCTSASYGGPDTGSATRSGTCTDGAGNTSAPVAFGFRFDATPPTGVSAEPARPPDHDGWYNRPFAVKWSGADALSGLASCSSASYGGPTNGASSVSGSCTDQAGNTSGAVGYAFRYDSTPPAFRDLSLTPRDDSVAVRWRASGATAFKVTRKPGLGGSASSVVYDGRASSFADRKVDNYVRYTYVVTAEDDAGNVLSRSGATTPMPVLYAPRPGARVSPGSRPLLAWRPARKARYYNAQLWLDGRAVGSWWPTRARLKLPTRWRFNGSARTLEAGAYTWYVWPGRGSRRLGRYGPLLGKSTFVVGSG
jgi:hypothetical protein